MIRIQSAREILSSATHRKLWNLIQNVIRSVYVLILTEYYLAVD